MTGWWWQDRREALLAPAVSLGFLLLVWAAAAGPVAVFSPSGRTRSFDGPVETPSVSTSSAGGPTLAEVTRDVQQTHDLSWLGDLIAWAVLILAGLVVLAGLRFAVRHRWRRAPAPRVLDAEPLPEERAAAALIDDAQVRLTALETGTPRNGIVACWALLEDVVADAGVPRGRHETSAEFTVRVLHVLDLDPQAIGELARLYREARFSEHDLPEASRVAARTALERLQDDLAASRGRA
jgi:hypothetical protein